MQPVTYLTSEPKTVTISYVYDALKRLTSASYDNGTAFSYTYDAAGNTLQLGKTISGQTSTTVYTYDIANQLATAQEGSGTVWQYHYDGNGSLVEMTPGSQAGSGARRYSYNTAGQLTKVETHDGTSYQPQAEMAYDGQGQRLALTAYQGEVSLTSHSLLDGETTAAVTANGQTTYYLNGIGEVQVDWIYYLADGMGSVRQLIDGLGQVSFTRSYTPWGEILDQSGQADLTTGYLGGRLDGVTGLIYLGNGQYYDPKTGRFLTRNANPTQPNPYVPWQSDPAGAMLAPIALLAMIYGRKKKRGKWDILFIILIIGVSTGISLSACGSVTPTQTPTSALEVKVTKYPTIPTPSVTVTDTQTATEIASTPVSTNAPTETPTICALTVTPDPNIPHLPFTFSGGGDWYVEAAKTVWGWLENYNGPHWWKNKMPSEKEMAAWLLFEEGGILNFDKDMKNMVRGIRYRFYLKPFGYASLSGFAAFYNPNGTVNGDRMFDQDDWNELVHLQLKTGAPMNLRFDLVEQVYNSPKSDDGCFMYWFTKSEMAAHGINESDLPDWGSCGPKTAKAAPDDIMYFTGEPHVLSCATSENSIYCKNYKPL